MAERQTAERGRIYGEVNSPEDVRSINREIRKEMDEVTTREQLTELKKRSDYLCTLTDSPAWKKKFGDRLAEVQQVAQEENRKTTAHANAVARRHGWEADYEPWGTRVNAMAYPPTTARYAGGGKVKYLVYHSSQSLRNGRVQERTRVKRLYFPANAREIVLSEPTMVTKRSGRRVCGVVVRYRTHLSATTAHRGKTTYQLPERWVEREKVVDLPEDARDVHLTAHPPGGPLQAVA
jgi:hypothetical protein